MARTGEQLASFWPAATWLSLATYKVSVLLGAIQNLFPPSREREILFVWSLGTVAMFVIWLRRWRSASAVYLLPAAPEEAAFLRVSARLRVRGDLPLRLTNPTTEPALRGIRRPIVTVPLGLLERLTPAEADGVLLHELAHAKRRDNLLSAFVHLLVCLFWFHPLLWLVERRLTIERERACDEAVLACGVNVQAYAAGILKVCQFHLFDAVPGISAMSGADLNRRLELILDKPAPPRLLYVPWLLVAGLTAFMTLVPVAGGYCEQCAQSSFESASPPHCPNPANCTQTSQKAIR